MKNCQQLNYLDCQITVMNTKKQSKTGKEQAQRQNNKRNDSEVIDERTRVIQKNLVFANGIPTNLHHEEILQQHIYFGRYGKINKIIINSGKGNRKPINCHAYVTYQTELQASLAIVALDGYNFEQRPMKVSYGTTKYCSSFIKGLECRNPECFYLHKLDKKMEVQTDDSRNVFKQQNDKALNVVCKNLQYVVEKTMAQQADQDGFPTYSEMLDFLIQSNFVNKNQIESIRKGASTPSKLTTIDSSPPMTKKRSSSPSEEKLTKSNSFSTVCTPSKPIVVQEHRKIVIEQKESKKAQKKIVQNQPQRKQKLEQMIEKMLIKKIMGKGRPTKSQLGFDSQNNQSEQQKIKAIIQKHLIAKI